MSCSDPHNANAAPYHYFGAVNAMVEKFLGIRGLVAKLKTVRRANNKRNVILNLELSLIPVYASVSAALDLFSTAVIPVFLIKYYVQTKLILFVSLQLRVQQRKRRCALLWLSQNLRLTPRCMSTMIKNRRVTQHTFETSVVSRTWCLFISNIIQN